MHQWINAEDDRIPEKDLGCFTSSFQGALLPSDAAPEHFRLYAAVQKEWFQCPSGGGVVSWKIWENLILNL